MKKKQKLIPPFVGVETIDNISVLYDRDGNYSAVILCENPILQYCADLDLFYDFHQTFENITKILGAGYTIQKQDIFSTRNYHIDSTHSSDFLENHYQKHFDGRPFTDITTYLIITGELPRSRFFSYDRKLFETFIRNIHKVADMFQNKGLKARVLSGKEIKHYIQRYFSVNFSNKVVGFDNISASEDHLKIGKTFVQNISLVDIDEVYFPKEIHPYKERNFGVRFPVDLLSFLHETPSVDCIIYNQVLMIPDQRNELNKLEVKKKRHSGIPDPANTFCVEDINTVMVDVAREGQLLIYSHFNVIVCAKEHKNLSKAVNFVESSLFDSGISVSKQCKNQFELFMCSLPGNSYSLKNYDRFLTTSSAAICLFFKERLKKTEDSPLLINFTNRQGVPIGIDMSGKEGEIKFTNNSNKFILGPSGSGKSFFMNAYIRQLYLANTDIVLVDTGHSYSGLCDYYGGRYITYSEEKPITMNPFKISAEEFNEEKKEFLKSLVALLWKGTDGVINQVEDTLLSNLISAYYLAYFSEGSSVKSLNFNSFYEFSVTHIQQVITQEGIPFDLKSFQFILKKFYAGGDFDKTLNNDFDNTLFDESFIVFEIDAIKDHKILFPIVTLIVMDVFIQKMRLKKNRKALIIEEAWKAIASPMMAGYILYLYKTVRKHWGEAMVVTQELDDIINNPVVKNSIINNSDIICLLDQTKFKDNYGEISSLLSLTEVEQKKIFTINNMNNKENRNRFNEVYIRRGAEGDVYGVEVSRHEYFTFTTERIEKDALHFYQCIYTDFKSSLNAFISDLEASGLKQGEFVRKVNTVLGHYDKTGQLKDIGQKVASKNTTLCKFIVSHN